MNPLPAELVCDFARAVESRALGISWASLAVKLGRELDEIRAWPDMYRSIWQSQFEAAELRLSADIAAEAVTQLRLMLRSSDEKIRFAAIREMLKHRVAMLTLDRRHPASDASISNVSSEALSDDELYIYTTELLHHLRSRSPEPLPAIADRESP